MKKVIGSSISLVVIDQAIKLFIFNFCISANVTFIPGILRFHPVQNTDLTWSASIVDYKTPAFLMIVLQILALLIAICAYRYLTYLFGKQQFCINEFLIFFTGGICCSFFDVAFWGGSLDFMRLFDWFTFDLKDAYLSMSVVFLLLYLVAYMQKYYKLSKKERREEREQKGVWKWIKRGCPIL